MAHGPDVATGKTAVSSEEGFGAVVCHVGLIGHVGLDLAAAGQQVRARVRRDYSSAVESPSLLAQRRVAKARQAIPPLLD